MSKHAGENLQHTALKRVKVIPPATDEVGALGTEADNLISDSATPSTPVLNTTGTGTSMVGNVPPTPTPIQRTKVGLKKTPRRRKQPIGASPHRTPTAAIRQKKRVKAHDVWHFFVKNKTINCIPCADLHDEDPRNVQNHTWKYSPSTSITVLRSHLERYHATEYVTTCKDKNWEILIPSLREKQKQPCVEHTTSMPRPEFSREGLLTHLVQWIAADDQSLNVVECIEFRKLLLYLRETLEEDDIPGRTKIRESIIKAWRDEFEILKKDMKNSLGRISFTADIWSDILLRSFLAITAHWIERRPNGSLYLRSALIAFHYLPGSHDGKAISAAVFDMLERADILKKAGWWTLDNASNNDTFMAELEKALKARHIRFSRDNNRVRCFAHVINISVQHILKLLREDPSGDILSRLRALVHFVRASGERRATFKDVIKEGNLTHTFSRAVPNLELLRDVDTRWDSAYAMGDRALDARPAIEDFFALRKYRDNASKNLTDPEWKTLEEVVEILSYPHDVQQLMSGEATPTLTGVLPVFQGLQNRWEGLLATVTPTKKRYIIEGMEWLNKYHEKAGRTLAYTMAMVLNPSIKLSFVTKFWSPIEQETAMEEIKAELAKYRTMGAPISRASDSTKQTSCARLRLGLIDSDDDEEETKTDLETEYTLYVSEKRTSSKKDILLYWQERETTFPTLFRASMDYLPIQASSVPSERVFSSSSETLTKRRSRIQPDLMEALQMLKFMLKKDRLNFMNGWKVNPSEMEVPEEDKELLLGKSLGVADSELDEIMVSILSED